MAHDVNKNNCPRVPGWHTSDSCSIGTLYYHFQQKIAYIPNLPDPLCFYLTITTECTRNSAIAEGLYDALVSRNLANYETFHLKKIAIDK